MMKLTALSSSAKYRFDLNTISSRIDIFWFATRCKKHSARNDGNAQHQQLMQPLQQWRERTTSATYATFTALAMTGTHNISNLCNLYSNGGNAQHQRLTQPLQQWRERTTSATYATFTAM